MENVTIDHCVNIIRKFEPIPENSQNGWLGIDGRSNYYLGLIQLVYLQPRELKHRPALCPLRYSLLT